MKRALQWTGGISSLLFVLACWLPTTPPTFHTVLEDSYVQVLHMAFVHHLQFGREIVFTYGPWGFLYGGYQPETHWAAILIWFTLAVVFWFAARRVSQLSFQNTLAGWAWVMAIIGLTGIVIFVNMEARLICWPLLLLLLYFFGEEREITAIQGAVIVSMGLLSLVKFSVLILNVAVVLCVAVDIIWRKRRFPWSAVIFGGSILTFWILARQQLSLFWPYVRTSLEMTAGYSEGMMAASPHEGIYIAWFASITFALIGVIGLAIWRRARFFGLLPLGALAFILFATFKYGFVRDDAHEATAALTLLLVSLMSIAIVWPVIRDRRIGIRAATFLPLIAIYVFTAFSFSRSSERPLTKQLIGMLSPGKLVAPFELFSNGESLRAAWQQFLADYRERFPLPPLKGDVDSYSLNQMELVAHGLPYRPRPIFQSYSAYTPHLAELNADHLRSDKAAQTILFDASTIDARYNSLDDGPSWPELLTRYDVEEVEFPFIVLQRSSTPRKFELTRIQETSVKLGEPFSVPSASNGVIWAEIEMKKTAAGSLTAALLKPSMLFLQTTLLSGRKFTSRFVPAMARGGFILSPFERNCVSFAALASTTWTNELAENAVATCIISSDDSSSVSSYQNSIRIRFYKLDYPKRDLDKVAGYKQVVQLKEALQRTTLLGDGELIYLPDQGSVLAVSPRSTIQLAPPQRSDRLHLGFGLSSNRQRSTNGVTFRASAIKGPQEAVTLWSRHVDPTSTLEDRGTHEAIIEMKTGEISQILLETIPDQSGTNETPRPYWLEMRFE